MGEKNKKYTIASIAEALMISKSTVSKALSNKPGVGQELRKKIFDYADEVGYTPNSIAQGLSKGKMNIIALIFGDIRNPFYADLGFRIQKILKNNGYMVMMLSTENDEEKEKKYIQMAQNLDFAGLILLTALKQQFHDILRTVHTPIVLVNRFIDGYEGNMVLLDNFKAGYIAAMHLIELGHSEIGFIAGSNLSSASEQRLEGYRQAMKNYGLQSQDCRILNSDLKMETGYMLGKQFAEMKRRPTAIVIVNDLTAIGFMEYCKQQKMNIPENLSVVSFDNISYSSLNSVNLTSVSQHSGEMGEQAARLMLKQLKYPDMKPERIILDPTLVIRGTTQEYKAK